MIFPTLKQTFVLAIAMMASMSTFAVPAKRVWRTITLTNGKQIEAMLVGDEHGHWLVDHDGKALAQNDDNKAYYMTEAEFSERKQRQKERAAKSNAMRVSKISKTRALSAQASSNKARKAFGQPTTIIGQKKGLVILVNFSDKSMKSAHNNALFTRRFNEVGYNETGCIGSVHDYFYDQSYGKLDIDFDVVGPVTVSKTHDYYGANDSQGNDKYAATMVIEAIKLADKQGVDFSKYDWDGDGYVDQVFIIYAGTGEAASEVTTDIWPHEYELSYSQQSGDGSGKQYIDGKYIDTYACSSELADASNIDGIGTACHEFSHCLGYADLYDTDYSGGQGMMYWDLLDAGSYNGPNSRGEVPAAYTSFERWWAGWMDLTVLSNPCFVKDMPALNDEPVAYKIVNDAYPNEYYLLENRQAKRWDSYTAGDNDGTGHGMLILHVDYDQAIWVDNAPNDAPSRQRMTYFPADNSYGTKQYSNGQYYWAANYAQTAGDPFPGTKKNTSFTDDSQPAATLYNANSNGTKKMGKPITNISESNGLISFTFMGGTEVPKVESAASSSAGSITTTWKSMEDAKSYSVRAIPYTKKTASEALLIDENFTNVKGGTSTSLDSKMDSYCDNKGWTGYKLFPASTTTGGTVKIGSSSTNGYLLSPTVNSTSGILTAVINGRRYDSTTATQLQLFLSQGGTDQAKDSYYLLTDNADHVTSFEAEGSCKLRFMFNKRGYINRIRIYDGEFTADDINASSASAKAFVSVNDEATPDTILVTGLTETSYTFTGLTCESYKIQVKAVFNNGSESEWSTPVIVTLVPTGIESLRYTSKIDDHNIYNVYGQMVGTDLDALPKGMYIIAGKKIIKR